jgi:uncharacterized protein YndB with AHSA1/START domain
MIKKSVVLACTPERAFSLFTEAASEWWPEDRRHTKDPTSEIRMLPTGRFWERAGDGHEAELGRVREWNPPHRLALDFYPGTDPQHPTLVVVTFVADGDGTLVTIEHGPTPASDDLWKQRAPRFQQSWELVLAALARHSVEALPQP